jgi:hypothetical protein
LLIAKLWLDAPRNCQQFSEFWESYRQSQILMYCMTSIKYVITPRRASTIFDNWFQHSESSSQSQSQSLYNDICLKSTLKLKQSLYDMSEPQKYLCWLLNFGWTCRETVSSFLNFESLIYFRQSQIARVLNDYF